MNGWVLIVGLILAARLENVAGLTCAKCSDAPCKSLSPRCEKGWRTCGCCPECARKVNRPCGTFKVNCEKRLRCIDWNGKDITNVPIFGKVLHGTCKRRRMNTPSDLC